MRAVIAGLSGLVVDSPFSPCLPPYCKLPSWSRFSLLLNRLSILQSIPRACRLETAEGVHRGPIYEFEKVRWLVSQTTTGLKELNLYAPPQTADEHESQYALYATPENTAVHMTSQEFRRETYRFHDAINRPQDCLFSARRLALPLLFSLSLYEEPGILAYFRCHAVSLQEFSSRSTSFVPSCGHSLAQSR